MKYARVANGIAVDVRATSPEGLFHPDVAAEFIQVDSEVQDGWGVVTEVRYDEGGVGTEVLRFVPPVVPAPLPPPKSPTPTPPQVSPVEFKMLFASAERVAIREARKTDAVVDDFLDLVEDPRLTYVDLALPSVQAALQYLVAVELLTEERVPEILSGKVL